MDRFRSVRARWVRRVPTTYQEETHASPYRIVRFAHHKRFQHAVDEIVRLRPARLLDYGTGDGFLIEQLHLRLGSAMPSVVAYDPWTMWLPQLEAMVERNALRSISLVSDLADLADTSFDVITCLSVLEHLPLPERDRFYAVCGSHLAADGHCLIEVPVEIGPSLIVKEAGRRLLKGRGAEYGLRELARLGAGGTAFDPNRFDPANMDTFIMSHNGFDYRLFAEELERRFQIVRRGATPFPRLPPGLGNQELFFVLQPWRRDGAPSVERPRSGTRRTLAGEGAVRGGRRRFCLRQMAHYLTTG